MILQAIEGLDEPTGSSKANIAQYIESKYGEYPAAAHTTLLTQHLNRMKDGGDIVFLKNNYMKPDPSAPPKRGRGRPPKPKDPNAVEAVVPTSTRPRGRPPKDPNASPRPVKPKVATSSGRPRGRPRKMARPSGGIDVAAGTPTVVAAVGSGRPRGRPPKVKAPLTEVSVEI